MNNSEAKLQLNLVLHTTWQNITSSKQSVVLGFSLRPQRENITNSHSSESGSNGKKPNFDLLLQPFVLKQLPLPFPNTAQPGSGGFRLNAVTTGYWTRNMPDWAINEMQLMPGRHGKCHEHSNKNCFCIISFFSFALVFWNISWHTAICSAFEGFPLKRGVAVLLLPQTPEKCFFSISFLLQPSASGLTHPSLVQYVSHQ